MAIRDERKTFPLWFRNSNNYASEYVRCLGNLPYDEEQTNTIVSVGSSSNNHVGGVMADNGCMYFIPFSSTVIMKYDILNGVLSTFGSVTPGWRGGVLAPNGKIYCIPTTSTDVLIIDTNDDSTSTVTVTTGSEFKWVGGVLAPNGKIYCSPYIRTNQMLVFDTSDNSFELLPTGYSVNGGGGWGSAALSIDGKTVYFSPSSESEILKIDTETNIMTSFGSFVGSQKWFSSINVGEFIYMMGDGSSSILKVNTTDDSTSLISSVAGHSNSCLTGSNKIVSSSFTSTYKIFDIETEITTSHSLPGSNTWGATLGIDGRVYFSPYGNANVYAVMTDQNIDKDFVLSRFNNKF